MSEQQNDVEILDHNGDIQTTAQSPFDLFCQENEASVKSEFLDKPVSDEAVSSSLAQKWNNLDEQSRQSYCTRFERLNQTPENILTNNNVNTSEPVDKTDCAMTSKKDESGDKAASQNEQKTSNKQVSNSSQVGQAGQGKCIRKGCNNASRESTEWDAEYCSASCCVRHCADIFNSWTRSLVPETPLTNNNQSVT